MADGDAERVDAIYCERDKRQSEIEAWARDNRSIALECLQGMYELAQEFYGRFDEDMTDYAPADELFGITEEDLQR